MCCVVHHKEDENVDKDINGKHFVYCENRRLEME